jgi:Bax protein
MKQFPFVFFALLTFSIEGLAKERVSSYSPSVIPEHMSVAEKKRRFFALMVPAVNKVHRELLIQYYRVKHELQKPLEQQDRAKITRLMQLYDVQTDEQLLKALKPHPQSIVLAQAAMESAWGTSRFFREANNVFGVWSINPNEPRIAASQKRGGKKTIYLRKFNTIEDSVREYYRMIGRTKKRNEYRAFKDERYNSDDVYEIVKFLNNYSERGEAYTKELSNMIRYNKLLRYDSKIKKVSR